MVSCMAFVSLFIGFFLGLLYVVFVYEVVNFFVVVLLVYYNQCFSFVRLCYYCVVCR
jgi:hypothetical protein